MPQIPPTKLIY